MQIAASGTLGSNRSFAAAVSKVGIGPFTNELNMQCPKCSNKTRFAICADAWGMYSENGFDPDADDLPSRGSDWTEHAGCVCPDCDHGATVSDFRSDEV